MTTTIRGPRECGRPTKSGAPCKQQVHSLFDVACGKHATDHDRELAAACTAAWRAGLDQGKQSQQNSESWELGNLRRRVAELEQAADVAARRFTVGKDQVVQVGKHAYRWAGTPPLAVGDDVWLPENWVSRMQSGPGPYRGTVTELGSTYPGELASIVRKAE